MIAFLTGTIHSIDELSIILLVNGIGYRVYCPSTTISDIHLGENIELYIHHHIRDDAQELFGVRGQDEHQFLQLVLKVSGVGPKMALTMLSQFTPAQLYNAVMSQDVALLTSISGIGKKTAERIVLELKDSTVAIFSAGTAPAAAVVPSADSLVVSALQGLGYQQQEIQEVLARIDTTLEPEEQIRAALSVFARS